jgi:hypothetical protein
MMKRLFSTTCIPADADMSKRTFLRRFVRDEDGNVTMLSIILIATGAVLSGIAWDLNSFEYRRVGIQQVADRAVLAAADLDQTLPPAEVVQDYFDKAGYGDVVSSVNVDEGLNYRTVSVNVSGLVAAQTIAGSYSGEALLSGNAKVDAQAEAEKRANQNRLLDLGMTDEEIYEDQLDEYRRGGVTREESDRIAELRILVRDTAADHTIGTSEAAMIATEYARLTDSTSLSYNSDAARDIAATLTQEDARNIVELRLEEQARALEARAAGNDDYVAADSVRTNEEITEDQWEASQRENGNYLEMQAFAEAEERVNNVEISMVLDISGSMASGDKMSNLRDAARTFVDAVINDSTQDLVSISIVPYSEHVSAGPAIMDEFNVNRTHSYSHCIEFSDADFETTEMGPSEEFDQVQHFYWGNTSYNQRTNPVCPVGQYEDVVAFSQDVTALKNKIGQLVPRGSTSIFAGMKWAAGLLDPSFQPINANLAADGETDPVFANRPVAFDDRETLKTVILMTDGQNHYSKRINPSVYANSSHWAHWNSNSFDWWVYRNVYSSQRQYWSEEKYWPSFGDQLLSNVCSAAKDQNIVIWSIGFEVTDHSADVMRDCASSPSHYFGVEGVEIKEAFTAIARQINQLRLTQ